MNNMSSLETLMFNINEEENSLDRTALNYIEALS